MLAVVNDELSQVVHAGSGRAVRCQLFDVTVSSEFLLVPLAEEEQVGGRGRHQGVVALVSSLSW